MDFSKKTIETKRRAIKFYTNQYMCTIHPKWSILVENRLVDTLRMQFQIEQKYLVNNTIIVNW
jgi:hypothetical protein